MLSSGPVAPTGSVEFFLEKAWVATEVSEDSAVFLPATSGNERGMDEIN